MKSRLIAINAKNVHTNLAVRYLYIECKRAGLNLDLIEKNINIPVDSLLRNIYDLETQCYCFSCYIWNIEFVLKLASSIKRLNPTATVILGGPEASFRVEEFLTLDYVQYVLPGDGEIALPGLLSALASGLAPENPSRFSQVHSDTLPFPYSPEHEYLPTDGQIYYYETSRGCPYQCSYCLSSAMYPVTYRSLEKVFAELDYFRNQNIPLVKFIDRTWNSHKERAKAIIQNIFENPSSTCFHFEAAGDLFDEELLELISKLPTGAIQFEIGIQSTNKKALEAACRTTDFSRLSENVKRLAQFRNMHIHLDLIAGLPYEDLTSFGKSFDDVFQLRPDMLQLGFLKLLHGSGLRLSMYEYEILANEFSPYEVLSTKWLSYADLGLLKVIEETLEMFYNSGRTRLAIDYYLDLKGTSPFAFFMDFSDYLVRNRYFSQNRGPKDSFVALHAYFAEKDPTLNLTPLLHLDWIQSRINAPLPEFLIMPNLKEFRNKIGASDFPEYRDGQFVMLTPALMSYVLGHRSWRFDRTVPQIPDEVNEEYLLIFNSIKGRKEPLRLLHVGICGDQLEERCLKL